MSSILKNPMRGTGLSLAGPDVIADPSGVQELLRLCPAHRSTPLRKSPDLAREARIAELWIKDERGRMGLGSFKALGAAHAIAREAAALDPNDWTIALEGRTFVTASAGNHGLSVAAGARLFSARAAVYIAETVPEAFERRLRDKGADVVREGADYEASMDAAARAAEANGWTLLSDSSWERYTELPLRVMEGYLQLAAEAVADMPAPPTHIILQAGVGGLAAAVAAHARAVWGDTPEIVVVEPAAAPALFESIRAGRLVTTPGPVSVMGRLDCKTPSLLALKSLSRDADLFMTISEDDAQAGAARLATLRLATTPSGGAGVSALFAGLSPGPDARVLTILSEGPEDE